VSADSYIRVSYNLTYSFFSSSSDWII